MHVNIRPVGNSLGVVIPKALLAQLGLNAETGAEMTIEHDALMLRKPTQPARFGWAEAAIAMAQESNDALVMGEFGNDADSELTW
jgi:antitoxin MazE